jgi:hypothetical protein
MSALCHIPSLDGLELSSSESSYISSCFDAYSLNASTAGTDLSDPDFKLNSSPGSPYYDAFEEVDLVDFPTTQLKYNTKDTKGLGSEHSGLAVFEAEGDEVECGIIPPRLRRIQSSRHGEEEQDCSGVYEEFDMHIWPVEYVSVPQCFFQRRNWHSFSSWDLRVACGAVSTSQNGISFSATLLLMCVVIFALSPGCVLIFVCQMSPTQSFSQADSPPERYDITPSSNCSELNAAVSSSWLLSDTLPDPLETDEFEELDLSVKPFPKKPTILATLLSDVPSPILSLPEPLPPSRVTGTIKDSPSSLPFYPLSQSPATFFLHSSPMTNLPSPSWTCEQAFMSSEFVDVDLGTPITSFNLSFLKEDSDGIPEMYMAIPPQSADSDRPGVYPLSSLQDSELMAAEGCEQDPEGESGIPRTRSYGDLGLGRPSSLTQSSSSLSSLSSRSISSRLLSRSSRHNSPTLGHATTFGRKRSLYSIREVSPNSENTTGTTGSPKAVPSSVRFQGTENGEAPLIRAGGGLAANKMSIDFLLSSAAAGSGNIPSFDSFASPVLAGANTGYHDYGAHALDGDEDHDLDDAGHQNPEIRRYVVGRPYFHAGAVLF